MSRSMVKWLHIPRSKYRGLVHDLVDNILALDDELLGWACSIVQGKFNPPFRGANRTNATKLERFNSLVSTFKAIYGNNPPITESQLSMSHILTYSIGNLLTAYNNITIHFEKYPKKYIPYRDDHATDSFVCFCIRCLQMTSDPCVEQIHRTRGHFQLFRLDAKCHACVYAAMQ